MRSFSAFLTVCMMIASASDAFCPSSSRSSSSTTSTTTQLFIFQAAKSKTSSTSTKPTFNKSTEQWERSPADDGVYPYDAVGALLRHGPNAFISRVTNPTEYEQFVLNYMAEVGVDRAEATGNVDAKLNNAMDWAYQKMEEKKGKPKVDYTVLKKKDAILAVIWAVFIVPLTASVIQSTLAQLNDGLAQYSNTHG